MMEEYMKGIAGGQMHGFKPDNTSPVRMSTGDIDWSNASEEDRLAEIRRVFASAVDDFNRQEHLRSMASDMLALLIEVLPYLEAAESDAGYKSGAVAKVVKKVRAAISKAEGR